MSRSAPRTQERTDNQPTLPPVIGVDRDGAIHRFDAVAGRLVVTDRDGDIVHEREMNTDEARAQWLPYIGAERGWVDCWFDADGFGDVVGRLARALDAVGEADR